MRLRRSQLFVPGNDERKIRKAVGLPCDSIIFDLEDAVPDDGKEKARDLLARLLGELDWGKGKELCLRVNPVDSPFFDGDMAKFGELDKISCFVIPKAEPESLQRSATAIFGKWLIPLVETATGFLQVEQIARLNGVAAISFGAQDFANSVGGNASAYSGNTYVKTRICVAAKAYGVDPIDCVFFDLGDSEGFRREALASRDLGYVGKQVVHPSQIEIANSVFSPTDSEVEEAKRVVEAYEGAIAAGTGAIRLGDRLVDAVHYRQARQVLDRRRAIGET
jgi:citrate lyase subunit beta/citryl-CoA lyase